jgi:hypothetical protein
MIIITEKQLEEKLVPASQIELDKLQSQAEGDPKLRRQVMMPLGHLQQYQYLFTADQKNIVGASSLLHVLDFIINAEGKAKVLFSKAGDKFTGFITYMDQGAVITGVKMASFFNDEEKASSVIVRDLRLFIDGEMKCHRSIEWTAFVDNSINKVYQSIVPKWFPQYGFSYKRDDKKINWIYRIFKK